MSDSSQPPRELRSHTISINIPVGYKPAIGPQPRQPQIGDYYLTESRANVVQAQKNFTHGEYIILVKDPPPIDTSSLEYKFEVVRQYMMGKIVQEYDDSCRKWIDISQPSKHWMCNKTPSVKIRVKPDRIVTKGVGEGELAYVNDREETVIVPR